jgi:hypothetical protein
MEIEHLFRYPALAVGLKPSASQGEARLRGLERIIYSKTIISVAVWRRATPGMFNPVHWVQPL